MSEPATESAIVAFLAAQLRRTKVEIANLQRIGVGRSRENWIFDLIEPHGAVEPLILRRDPDGGLVDTDRATEFALLTSLRDSPIPAPQPLWLDATGDWFGKPSLIMRREAGTCDYRVINGNRPLHERVRLARTLCELLARVHAVPWHRLRLDEVLVDPGAHAADHELAKWERTYRQDQLEAYPEIEFAIDKLSATAPASAQTVLVHGDFKPGNILLDGQQVVALLDWELAHLGDPLEDVGWVTQPLRRREHLIAGQWEVADLIAHYEAVTGRAVDRTAHAWWQVFSTFKTAVMQVSGLRAFIEGRSDEPFRPTKRVLSTMLAGVDQLPTEKICEHASHH